MTTVEQEMEALLQDITTARSHHSQLTNGAMVLKSHRSSQRNARHLIGGNSAKQSHR
jgi:hypothetical protein